MPSKLPVRLRASFMVRRLANWFFTAIRCAFVVAVWLGFVPWVNLSFLRFSLWLVDVLVWTTIGSTSTWTGVAASSGGLLNATMPSTSLPAAPSPPFRSPGQERSSVQELVGSGSGGSADSAIHLLLMVPVDFLLSFCSQMVPRQVTYIIELALSLYLIGIPSPSMQDAGSSLGSRRTASRRTAGDAESLRTFFRFMAHDVFLGQLLTCGITIAVLAVWFTREWVVMQMPVQVPDAEGQPGAEEDVGVAEPEAEAAAGAGADADPEAPIQAPPVAQRERRPAYEEVDNRAFINLNESSDDVDQLELASLLNPSELRAARIARFDADSSSSSNRAARNANAFALQSEKNQPDEDWWSRDFDPLINGYGNGASRIVGDDREGDALSSGSNKIDDIDDDDNEEASGESGRRQDILQPTGSPESRLAQVRSSNPEHATDLRNGSMTRNGSDETESKRLGSELDARANTDRPTQQSSDDGDIPQPVVGEGGNNGEDADSRDNGSEADESAGNEGNVSGDNEATASEGGAGDDSIVIAVAGGNDDDDDDDEDEDDVNSDDSDAAHRPPAMGLLPPPNENEIRDALVQALERQQDLAEMPDGQGQEGEEWGAEVDVELAAMVEAIGFHGDPMNLLANVSIIIALGFAFVLLLVALPFGLGRTLGLGRGIVDVALAPVRLLRMATDPAIDWLIDAITRKSLHLWSSSLHRPSSKSYEAMTTLLSPTRLASRFQTSSMKHASTPSPFNSVYSTFVMGTLTYLATPFARIETILMRPSHTTLDVIICVAIGHGWWMAMLSLRLLADKYAASRQGHVYRQWWLPELVTQALIVAKVLAFLAIEIVVFPVGCGLVLDACTLPLFGASPSSRLADVTARPLSWVFVRWAIGTMWMYRFGLYVSHVRGALRPGVLSWIRDPEDPDFQPIKEILERKSGTQLRKIGASAVMYASLIVLLVGANVWTLRLVLPATSSLLPLRIQATLQDDQVLRGTSSLDLLAILFILPLLTDRLDPESIASKFSQRWWRFAAHHSGLSEYLLGSEATKSTTTTTASRGQQASTNDGVLPHNESFLARIPASDNSVIGSPLLIRLDDDTEEPVTDRGKEALRIQRERIEKMKEPKAKYINMRLQNDFGRRMFLVLASLWMSMSVGLQSAAVPLLLGRWLSSGRWHDVHAFVLGCVVIAPVSLAMYALAQTPAVQKRLQSRAWGGSSLHKRSRRRGPTFGRLRARIQRRAKRWMGVAWLSFALGAITPTLLGIAVDQCEWDRCCIYSCNVNTDLANWPPQRSSHSCASKLQTGHRHPSSTLGRSDYCYRPSSSNSLPSAQSSAKVSVSTSLCRTCFAGAGRGASLGRRPRRSSCQWLSHP